MNLFALDTNLLVYAHNADSVFHTKASAFVEQVMNERDAEGKLSIRIPVQVFMEFIHVMTWAQLEKPISLSSAIRIVQDYLDSGVSLIHQQHTQLQTTLELLQKTQSRKRLFDVALAATLKNNHVVGLYTVNTKDFEIFDFLKVINPLE
ncbi:MAG: type II toxin-antitoxin system VapC family toxin [SAR324 cluster bacterium]|nr:type II toxin-antitoxin system VapC family toxin [SAR324 cluster bacterium]